MTPPPDLSGFASDESERRAKLLKPAIAVVAAASVAVLVLGAAGVISSPYYLQDGLALLGTSALSFVLASRGRVRPATAILVVAMTVQSLHPLFLGGVSDVRLSTFVLRIVFFGLLVGGRTLLGLTLLYTGAVALAAYAELRGWVVPFDGPHTSAFLVDRIAAWSVIYAVTGAIVWLYQRTLARAAQTAHAQTSVLARTLDALSGELDLDRFLGQVLTAIAEQLGAQKAGLFVHDPAAGTLSIRVCYEAGRVRSHPLPSPGEPLRVERAPFFAELVRTRRPVFIADVKRSQLCGDGTHCDPETARSFLAVPLIAPDRVVGFLGLPCCVRSGYSEKEVELARALAHLATLAMELARLFERAEDRSIELEKKVAIRTAELAHANWALAGEVAERRRREQVSLAKTAFITETLGALAVDPNLDDFLDRVLKTIAGWLGVRSAAIWLRDRTTDTLVLHLDLDGDRIRSGADAAALPAEARPIPRHRRPTAFEDVLVAEELAPYRRCLAERGVRALLDVPMVLGDELIGSFCFRKSEPHRFTPEEIDFAQALVHQATLAVQLTRLAEQGRRAAVLEERGRMIRDIHDTLAQGFTGIVIQLEAAEDALGNDVEDARAHLCRARRLARESLAEARRTMHALRPQALAAADLGSALGRLARETTSDRGVRVDFRTTGATRAVPDEVADALLRIGQEALTNAVRHAEARSVAVELAFEAELVRLSVKDDGRGFDPERANGDGIGVRSMRERADRIRAAFAVESADGSGTAVVVSVPVAEAPGETRTNGANGATGPTEVGPGRAPGPHREPSGARTA